MGRMTIAFVLLLAGSLPLSAKEFRTIELKPHQGIIKALLANGCNAGWLGTVMVWTGIRIDQLERLPVGKRLFVPEGCAAEPPAEIVGYSNLVIAAEATGRRRLGELRARSNKIAVLRNEAAKLRDENAGLRLRVYALDEVKVDLRKELAELNADYERVVRHGRIVRNWFVAGLVILFTFALIGLLLFLREKKKRWSRHIKVIRPENFKAELEKPDNVILFRKVVFMPMKGEEPLEFRLASVEYMCQKCSQAIRMQNLKRHTGWHAGIVADEG